jgi:hypothetical protein
MKIKVPQSQARLFGQAGESVDMASNLSSAHNDSAAAAGGLFSFQ